jgi:hypothetical protein
MKLHIDIEVVNQVLGYLGTRPYQEVFQYIQAIQEAAKPPVQEISDGNQVDSESNQ